MYSKSRLAWTRFQASLRPGGALYHYNGSGGTHIPAGWRVEPDGGVSAVPRATYALHFWPMGSGFARINAADVGAVFTTVQARLIGGTARYILNVGADYYPASGSYPFGNHHNAAVGESKYIYLSPSWQAISFYTGGPTSTLATSKTSGGWSQSQLQATPPPMDGMGLP